MMEALVENVGNEDLVVDCDDEMLREGEYEAEVDIEGEVLLLDDINPARNTHASMV